TARAGRRASRMQSRRWDPHRPLSPAMADQDLKTPAPAAAPSPELRRSSVRVLSEQRLGDTLARYLIDDATQAVGLLLVPVEALGQVQPRRAVYSGGPEYGSHNIAAFGLYGLLPLKRLGDAYSRGFSAGQTLQGASALRFKEQRVSEEGG